MREAKVSFLARDWARKVKLDCRSMAVRLVLREIAEYHNVRTGLAWPTEVKLCQGLSMPRRTLQWAIAWLVENGLMERTQRANGKQSSQYKLLMTPVEGAKVAHSNRVEGAKSESSGRKEQQLRAQGTANEGANSEATVIAASPSGTVIEPLVTLRLRPKGATKKIPLEVFPKVQEVLGSLKAIRGYEPKSSGAEALAISRMIQDGSTPFDVLECYKHFKAEPFWSAKELTMMYIAGNIQAWKAGKNGTKPIAGGKDGTYRGHERRLGQHPPDVYEREADEHARRMGGGNAPP